jgi:hypothetical protein
MVYCEGVYIFYKIITGKRIYTEYIQLEYVKDLYLKGKKELISLYKKDQCWHSS